MDRRSFMTSLIGGLAVAGLGGVAASHAASAKPDALKSGVDAGTTLEPDVAAALDGADAEYSQYYHRHPRHYRRRYRRHYGHRHHMYRHRRRHHHRRRNRIDWRAR